MSIFVFNIFLLAIWAMVFHKRLDPRQNGSKLLIWIVSVQLFVFVAATPLINDALNYELYAKLHSYGNIEIGWKLFSELVWWLVPDGKALVLFTNLIISVSFGVYVWRNSRNIILSYFIYICLGIWGMTFFILRQTIALAILLVAFEFVKRKQPIPFFIAVILASCFHQTALIFVLMYPISLVRRNSWYHMCALLTCFVGIVFGGKIIEWLLSMFRNGSAYGLTDMSGVSYFVMLLGFLIFACVANQRPDNECGYHASEIAVVLQTLSFHLSNFFRAVQYYSIHLSIVLPDALLAIENRSLRFLFQMFLVAFFLIFYFVIQDCAYPDGSANWYLDWL